MTAAADGTSPPTYSSSARPNLLDTKQAAEYLGMGESTLRAHRKKGTGPPYVYLGRRFIRYTVHELDRWVEANSTRSSSVTTEDLISRRWWDMVGLHGRKDFPQILRDHFEAGSFTVGTDKSGRPIHHTQLLAYALENAWCANEYPEEALEEEGDLWSAEQWFEMFTAAERHLKFPESPVTLYRGVSDESFKGRMSWTSSLETARWFAKRKNHLGDGVVLRLVDVNPGAVLAVIDGRNEDEYVLDLWQTSSEDIEIFEDYRKTQPPTEPTATTTEGLQ